MATSEIEVRLKITNSEEILNAIKELNEKMEEAKKLADSLASTEIQFEVVTPKKLAD